MRTDTIRVSPRELSSFEEIMKISGLTGFNPYLKTNKTCFKAIFSPVLSKKEEEITLCWEGQDQIVPGGDDFYLHLASRGFEVVKNYHPSLLVYGMSELTEERLEKARIPSYVDIVFPVPEGLLLPYHNDCWRCFLKISRNNGQRKLETVKFDGRYYDDFSAFLVQKI